MDIHHGPWLTNRLLVATPALHDSSFDRAVLLLCEHGAGGAMGFVVNRPLPMTLGDLAARLNIAVGAPARAAVPIFQGGPVEPERGFVLYAPAEAWATPLTIPMETEDAAEAAGAIGIAASRDILEAIAAGRGPQRYLIVLGYSGWLGGQLEREMAANAWLSVPAHADILFNGDVAGRRQAAAGTIGVNLAMLSSEAGHA